MGGVNEAFLIHLQPNVHLLTKYQQDDYKVQVRVRTLYSSVMCNLNANIVFN